jgi:type IV pilus assembly protein PilQ
MGLSGHKRSVLVALLWFIATGLCVRTARAALNETVTTQLSLSEVKQDREAAMEQLMQKIDEPAEPAKVPSKPVAPKKTLAPVKPAEKPRSLVPAKIPASAKETVKPEKVKAPVKKTRLRKVVKKRKVASKVNIDFTDVPLSEILATIAQNTDLNIIGGEESAQKITVHLKDVPLDILFEIILKSTDLGYIKEGEIIRIVPKADLPMRTEVFELRYASAEKIMEAVAHLLTQKGKIKSFSGFSQSTPTDILVVTDVADSIKAVGGLIKKLDKKVKQVMIEVKFCEVTLNKDDELGIDWVVKASMTGARGNTTFPWGRLGQGIPEAPYGMTVPSANLTLGTVSFSEFSATLHALDSKSNVKLIATPQVAARSGQTAQIIIGDKIPIPTYERSAETGSMEVTGYDFENVGVVLSVTPFVNNDDSVTISIHPEVSEIIPGQGVGPNGERPTVSTREISTVFTVANGETIVLGGLKRQSITDTETKVPILGNIPFLGRALFTYKGKTDDRKELLLFITPHVLVDDPKKEST